MASGHRKGQLQKRGVIRPTTRLLACAFAHLRGGGYFFKQKIALWADELWYVYTAFLFYKIFYIFAI